MTRRSNIFIDEASSVSDSDWEKLKLEDFRLPDHHFAMQGSYEFEQSTWFWECKFCHASVLYMIDDCPNCAVMRRREKGRLR